jgi:hypothetical protein
METASPFKLTRFDPWVGSNYYARNNRLGGHLLILGESHHADDPNQPRSITIDVTRMYVTGNYTQKTLNGRFWTTIASTVTGQPYWEVDRREFWESVAFYNYVPGIVGDYSRIRPTDQLWLLGREPFLEVLEKLLPGWILVLGSELWSRLPSDGGPGPTLMFEGATRDTWWYPAGSAQRSLAMGIPHPVSFGFSWRKWHPWVRALMNRKHP